VKKDSQSFLEPRKIADRERLDTRVLEHLDQLHLRRHQLLGADGAGAVDHVGRAVGGGGAVGLDPGDPAEAVEGIRQMDLEVFDEGAQTLARLVVARGRAHEEGPCPECAQIEVELALVVDEQGPAALLLKHRARRLGLKPEIGHLTVEIACMGLSAPERPAAQTAERELGEQLVHVLHHRAQATRRLARQLMQQVEIPAHHLRIPESARGQRHAGHDERHHRPGGVRRELHQGAHHLGDDVLAHLLGDPRHLLHIGQDQVDALVQAAHRLDAGEVMLQPARRHDARGFVVARFQRLGVRVIRVGLEAGEVFGEVDAHSV
jgi:hypothetical protein